MKNIFAFALLISSCLLIHAANKKNEIQKLPFNENLPNSIVAKKKVTTHLHVRLGRPQKDCYGLGFCYISFDRKSETISDRTNAIMITDHDTNNTTLYLKNLQGKQFSGYFHIDEETLIHERLGTLIPKIYEMERIEKEIEGQTFLYKIVMNLE